jgi:FkbM family methyltransferase
MTSWRRALSLRLRERVLRHYLVPYSRFGLDGELVAHLPRHEAITLIDIGANRGDFSAAVLGHCGIKRALLIEPQEERCTELKARFADPRFAISRCALLDRAGSASLQVLGADSCSSLLPVKADAGFSDRHIDVSVDKRQAVSVSTLDELLARHEWQEPIDLLKIDTQGTELQILRGATRALSSVRLLWIEVSFRSLYEGDAQFPEIHGFLGRSGFRLFSFHEAFRGADGELLQADALFLGPLARWSPR